MKFKIGDRVSRVFNDDTSQDFQGIIKAVNCDTKLYAVEFKKNKSYFHSCGGLCNEGKGYWCREEQLKYSNIKPTKKELLELPIGTKLTTNTGKIFIKLNSHTYMNTSGILAESSYLSENLMIKIINNEYKDRIVSIEVPEYGFLFNEERLKLTHSEIEKIIGFKVEIVEENE